MGFLKIIGVIVIALGATGLVYKQISYTKENHQAQLGGLELSLKEQETVVIPTWLSIGAIVIGAGLLALGGRQRG